MQNQPSLFGRRLRKKKLRKAIPLNPRFAISKGDSTTVVKLLTHSPFTTSSVIRIIGTCQLSRCRHITQSTRPLSDSRRPSARQPSDPLHSPVAVVQARRIAAQQEQELDMAMALHQRLGRTMRRSANCRTWSGVMKKRSQSVRYVWRSWIRQMCTSNPVFVAIR